jgi:hypothetical protein
MLGGAALRRLLASGDLETHRWFRGAVRHDYAGLTLRRLVRLSSENLAGRDFDVEEPLPASSEADLVFISARASTPQELRAAFTASGCTHSFAVAPAGRRGAPAADAPAPPAAAAAALPLVLHAPRHPPTASTRATPPAPLARTGCGGGRRALRPS